MHVEPKYREKRWSMNSQRLEVIVGELMKPISDIRRNFDTDLSALLEEYLTEAGLRALEEDEGDSDEQVAPNFAEIALLLQQSAHIYSRKVDCLYQDVLRVTDALNNCSLEESAAPALSADAERSGGNKQRSAEAATRGFAVIRLEAAPRPWREASLRPAPTLPRICVELEPRPPALVDVPEPIGLHADFQVFSTIKHGYLEELEECRTPDSAGSPPTPRPPTPPLPPPPLTLPQLSAPSPLPSPLLPPSPFNCSTPVPRPLKLERKRRLPLTGDADSAPKLLISEEVLRGLRGKADEFGLSPQLVRRVGEHGLLLQARMRLPPPPFRGWDNPAADIGGFCGWPAAAARSALDTAQGEAQRLRLRPVDESDDDGFFEQSSSSDGEPRRSPEPPPPDWRQWREAVLARSSDAAPDMRHTAALLLRSAPAAPAPPAPFPALLRHHHAAHGTRPAHLVLAALFLANSGNIEIVPGEPLTLDSFSVRLLSADEALYRPAMARDPALT